MWCWWNCWNSPTTSFSHFSNHLLKTWNNLKTSGMFNGIFYGVEQKDLIPLNCVNHRQKPLQKTHWLQNEGTTRSTIHSFSVLRAQSSHSESNVLSLFLMKRIHAAVTKDNYVWMINIVCYLFIYLNLSRWINWELFLIYSDEWPRGSNRNCNIIICMFFKTAAAIKSACVCKLSWNMTVHGIRSLFAVLHL